MKTMTQDEMAVLRLHEEVLSSFNTLNLEKLLSLHTDNVVLMEPNMQTINGKQEVIRLFEKLKQQRITLKLFFKILEIEIFGTRAFVRGQVIKTTTQKDGVSFSEKGKFVSLLQKQHDGSWLRTHVIVNSDMPTAVNHLPAELLLAHEN